MDLEGNKHKLSEISKKEKDRMFFSEKWDLNKAIFFFNEGTSLVTTLKILFFSICRGKPAISPLEYNFT